MAAAAGLMLVTPADAVAHTLKATKDTVHWGYFSKMVKPALTINSGDTVTVEMVSVSVRQSYDLPAFLLLSLLRRSVCCGVKCDCASNVLKDHDNATQFM